MIEGGPVIVTPRTAPPPGVVLRPIALGLAALALTGLTLLLDGLPQGQDLLALIHLGLVAGLLTLATAAAVQLSAATTGRSHPRPALLGLMTLLVPAGGICLTAGFRLTLPPLLALGGLLAIGGLAAVFVRSLAAIVRSQALRPLHLGLLVGLAGFLCAGVLGLVMAIGLTAHLPNLLAVLPWHLALAFGAGFGALLSGVSWQLLGMFGRGRQLGHRAAVTGTLLFAFAAPAAAWLWGIWGSAAAWLLAGAALYHLALVTASLLRSPSHRLPPFTGVAHLLAAASLVAAAVLLSSGLPSGALGAAFGGIAVAVLGYLERILPFLVFERHLAGRVEGRPVPKLTEILPPRGRGVLLALYLLSLALALLGWPLALRSFGLALFAMSLRLLLALRWLRPAFSQRGRNGQL